VLAGAMVIEVSAEDSTTKSAVSLTDPSCAVIIADPADWPVTCPPGPIVTISIAEELHVTTLVMF